jgi:hypothetical protein
MTGWWLAAPVSVPYVRYSRKPRIGGSRVRSGSGARCWPGLSPRRCWTASRFRASRCFPDTPVGTDPASGAQPALARQHPDGRARVGVVALRRAARAVQAGDADVVACVAGDANQDRQFPAAVVLVSRALRWMHPIPMARAGRMPVSLLIADAYMAEYGLTREDFGRIAVAQRTNALALSRTPS